VTRLRWLRWTGTNYEQAAAFLGPELYSHVSFSHHQDGQSALHLCLPNRIVTVTPGEWITHPDQPAPPQPQEGTAMTPAEAAARAAARYGVHLAGDAAAAAAAVLACHDGVAESSEIVWPEAWERDKEPRQRRMALTLLEEVIDRGELPVERPQVHIREARDVPYGPTMEVRMSVRTRRPAAT